MKMLKLVVQSLVMLVNVSNGYNMKKWMAWKSIGNIQQQNSKLEMYESNLMDGKYYVLYQWKERICIVQFSQIGRNKSHKM